MVLPTGCRRRSTPQTGEALLFIGDDWAEDHHDVELMDAAGKRLARARLPEGVAGMARLHAMIGEQLGDDADELADQVLIGIETDRGPWVQALIAAGYRVFAVNPLQASEYRKRHSVSGAKSDAADAHVLADMVRTDAHQLRTVAGDRTELRAAPGIPELNGANCGRRASARRSRGGHRRGHRAPHPYGQSRIAGGSIPSAGSRRSRILRGHLSGHRRRMPAAGAAPSVNRDAPGWVLLGAHPGRSGGQPGMAMVSA